MSISPSIRALYRIIGEIIGKEIFGRIKADVNLAAGKEERIKYAREVIDTITSYRAELRSGRDFQNIYEITKKLFDKDNKIAVKQFAWILEAYLLLNQSSSASAEVTKPDAKKSDRLIAFESMQKLEEKGLSNDELKEIFENIFSVNLVLTAHPTAGIQPDYVNHIKNMVTAVQKISERVEPSKWQELKDQGDKEKTITDITEDIRLAVAHMVRAKPYNISSLRPSDESRNFLFNLEEAWDIIPAKLLALENELKEKLGADFRLNSEAFKIHSWVARDIDGNPTVSEQEHFLAVIQERINFLNRYKLDLFALRQSLSDDFNSSAEIPNKVFFIDDEFAQLYQKIISANPNIVYKDQAYRVVLDFSVIHPLELAIESLYAQLQTPGSKQLIRFDGFSIEDNLIKPLELIRKNKEGLNTKEIDLLIKKALVFGGVGSYGHTRQGNKALNKLCKYLTGLQANEEKALTDYVQQQVKHKPIDIAELKKAIQTKSQDDNAKLQFKLMQTIDLLLMVPAEGIKRQIISMNETFCDMLSVLTIHKYLGYFKPAGKGTLPLAMLEIVPLTEQIIDLRNSYQVTIDALSNSAWHEYLIAHKAKFVKMRGPSDSGKQNGFCASQWEMFKSKQQDTLVVEVFNAYLKNMLEDNSNDLVAWRKLEQELSDANHEKKILALSFDAFEKVFNGGINKDLWQQAHKELGIKAIKLVSFDGWGEPIERGGGLEFEDTVKCTQPFGSIPHYERTLQGGGAQQLASGLRTKEAIRDLVSGVMSLTSKKLEPGAYVFDPEFTKTLESLSLIIRSKLRTEVFGIDIDDDNKVSDEKSLRTYFRHVIKSPLVYLDLFNIASRPTSRSGSQIKEYLDDPAYSKSLDKLAESLAIEEVLKILGDVRAIPYAAMFSLLGGNHVSFYGFGELLKKENYWITENIKKFYFANDASQEHKFIKHMLDSLEQGIFTADIGLYAKAHEIIQKVTNADFKAEQDELINKIANANQNVLNFIAEVKNYKVADKEKVLISELHQNQESKDIGNLLDARRNDAVIPRLGVAISIAEIVRYTFENNLNPLDQASIPENLLDLLRKAFAAGASTYGNGCID